MDNPTISATMIGMRPYYFSHIYETIGGMIIDGQESHCGHLLNKINDLATLPVGWEYGKGIPTRKEVVAASIILYAKMLKFGLKSDAFPWTDGSISLVFHKEDMCVEVSIHSKDDIDVVVEKGYGSKYDVIREIYGASYDDIEDAINEMVTTATHPTKFQQIANSMEQKWHLSGSFTKGTMINQSRDSEPVVSRIQATDQGFQLSPWSVSERPGKNRVATLSAIMPASPENQPYIGKYQ